MTSPAEPEDSVDPTTLYDPNDPRYYGYSRTQLRLWHGMTTWAFVKMMWGNFRHVSPQRYGLVASVLALSLTHSFVALLVNLFYTSRLKAVRFAGDPICILGFQRSGTTFLNELLACDDRFAFPDNMQCFMPESFLILEKRLRTSPFAKLEKRPMDDMDMSMDAPQEDEIALMNMGVPSPYRQIAFPSRRTLYHDALERTMNDEGQRRRWSKHWVWFLRKVQYRSPNKRLLLKSPTHTIRVSLIRDIFPDAKFIHITRNPYRILQSNLKLGKALSVTQGFESKGMTDEGILAEIKDGFPAFHEAYEKQKKDVPEGHLVTVSYEDLVKDPLVVMRKIYEELNLPDIEHAIPAMQAYIDSRKDYKPNKYKEDPEMVKLINDNWGMYFDTYGYERLAVEGEEAPEQSDTVATLDTAAPESDAETVSDDNTQVSNANHG